jgi:hypothetical protein
VVEQFHKRISIKLIPIRYIKKQIAGTNGTLPIERKAKPAHLMLQVNELLNQKLH